jgi:hypothetical protein
LPGGEKPEKSHASEVSKRVIARRARPAQPNHFAPIRASESVSAFRTRLYGLAGEKFFRRQKHPLRIAFLMRLRDLKCLRALASEKIKKIFKCKKGLIFPDFSLHREIFGVVSIGPRDGHSCLVARSDAPDTRKDVRRLCTQASSSGVAVFFIVL